MISIIIPYHNEEENLLPLHKEINEEMNKMKRDYEIVLVNDGSTDGSGKVAAGLAETDHRVKDLFLRKRLGKGEALAYGVRHSKGDVILFMDADLQDNPADISKFLKKIDGGFDLVNGVRTERHDHMVIKTYSRLGNNFLRKLLHSPFSDINCGFKAFKRQVLDEIALYANNFRFLPLAAFYNSYKVTEVPVDNRSRIHGVSKFGMGKAFIGLIDTFTVYFLYQFSERPLHFFGTIGGIFFVLGSIVTVELIIERVFFHVLLYRRPLFQLGMFLVIVGIQIIMSGFIGELIVFFNKKRLK